MKIAFASTYPPQHCGIANYTRTLTDAIAAEGDVEIVVLSEQGGQPQGGPVGCIPVFSRNQDFSGPLVRAAVEQRVRLVHVQHAPDIFGMGNRLYRLLVGLRREGIASVVTLHTVYSFTSGLIERKPHAPGFHRMLGNRADRLLVHQPSMQRELERQGIPSERIVELPHGTQAPPSEDGSALRTRLGIPASAPLLLFFGFVHVQKNVHTLLLALKSVLRERPDVHLVIAGEVAGGTWYNRAYFRILREMVQRLKLSGHVHLERRFIPGNQVGRYYAAADIVLLPHNQGYGSASGVAHDALAARKPLLCSDTLKFEEIGRSVSPFLMVPTHRPSAWAQKILALLNEPALRAEIGDRVARYAAETSWARVAAAHLDLYRRL